MRVFSIFLLLCTSASAHDFYDRECCSNRDCAPVASWRVKPLVDGWHVDRTDVVPYLSPKVRSAPDGKYHICRNPFSKKLLCIYVPPHGS